MNREDKLYTMNGATLIKVADNLGVKVACNRIRTQLKESKAAVIARILEAEKMIAETDKIEEEKEKEKEEIISAEKETKEQYHEIDDDDDNNEWEDDSYEEKKKKAAESDETAENIVNKKKAVFSKDITGKEYYHGFQETPPEKKTRPGKGAQLEYKGKSQNICAWAKELGISANTLYGRIYKMGWTIEKAFETRPRRK